MLAYVVCLAVFTQIVVPTLSQQDSFCAEGSNWYFYLDKLTWNDSREFCLELGESYQLAILDTKAKDKAVRQRILRDPTLKKAPGNGYWMGCEDLGCEGHFHWLEGDAIEHLAYSNWYQDPRGMYNQPNDNHQLDETGQDCCQLWKEPRKKPVFAWDDDYCWRKKGYVCEEVLGEDCPAPE
ncbi:salivary C-type lectin 2-like [Saccoglossus kowalevskii]|uniref:Hepatic lectin-like n=1 Tax=Saccoglossus kowalevskii TaxID=10224 RepID=A0ABM0GPJ3_SACKO|nr:PREDICTED: hepatic lectin-like [Saccoglossus kowalevskii]